ncbi:MAG: hypothetical protein AAF560_16820 [Acidobacteriota bacterium]
MKREVDADGMQISTRELDRYVMQVAGALRVGEPIVTLLVGLMRKRDPALKDVFDQLRSQDCDIEQLPAGRELEKTNPNLFTALLNLQNDKPLVLRSLVGLTGRANWQEQLEAV